MLRGLPVGALAAVCLLASGAALPQEPVFRGVGEAVRVFVTVTNRDGRLVTNLARTDFEVRDDGQAQPITQFDNTPVPIRLVVMLDVSGSMAGNLTLLRSAALQLFSRLGPEDEARVGSFGHDITISEPFTRDQHALLDALPTTIAPDAPTPLWRALDQAMNTFGAPRADVRPVILVLSDGKDADTPSFRHRLVSQAEVIERARREDVMMYAIGMRSRPAHRQPPGVGPGSLQGMLLADLPDPGLARVAEETGGGYTEIRFGQDLGAAFAAVADELHSQYLLGFVPPRHDGKTHAISVRLAQAHLKARARKSYVAPRS